MLKIKLSRFGKRNQPHFRIVVNEARDKRDGSYVEMVGHYAPTQQPKLLELDVKKYDAWIAKGAQSTETVAYLYEVAKAGKGFPVKKKKPSKKQLKKKTEAQEKPAEKLTEKPVEKTVEKAAEKEAVVEKKEEEKVEKKEEAKVEEKVEDKKTSKSEKSA